MRLAEKAMKNAFHCQTADCPGWAIIEEDNINVFRCPVCRKSNCLTCQAIHEGANCKEFQDQVNESAETDEDAKRTKEMIDVSLVNQKSQIHGMKCQYDDAGIGGQWRGSFLPPLSSCFDETLGLRLGQMFCLSHRNLLGYQTKPLGSQGNLLSDFLQFVALVIEWFGCRVKEIPVEAVGVVWMELNVILYVITVISSDRELS